MSPLVSAPARGYADYQRLENFDTGILLSAATPLSASSFSSPIIDVSRFAYLCGQVECITANCAVALNYFIDALGTVNAGNRNFILTAQGLPAGQIHITNLGPFVQFFVEALGAVPFQFNASIFASNRVELNEFVPQIATLIDLQNATEPAGATAFYPNAMFAGPMSVGINMPVAATIVSLEALNSGGTWDIIAQTTTGASGVPMIVPMIAPLGAWRILVSNPGAATVGMYLVATPSNTGAS